MRVRTVVLLLGALLLVSGAQAQQQESDASVKEQLANLERSRKELEAVTEQLNAERAKLEQQTEQAHARSRLMFVAGGVGVLVIAAGGVAWFARRRRKGG